MLQVDVCYVYQLLRKGGVKEENIVVFMYDDIVKNKENLRFGIIINSFNGNDVYNGIFKVFFFFDFQMCKLLLWILLS